MMEPRDDENNSAENEPCFVISIAAKLVNVHQQTLRYYEKLGLLAPGRSQGNIRLYSMRDIQRAQMIRRLIDELGVNLAGVDVIMNMTDRLAEMEQQMDEIRQQFQAEIDELHRQLSEYQHRR